MFQTFTGNSRRPRQVNLSGRGNNPFASTQQKSSPQGVPSAVWQAQQERKARQEERARLQAARSIQRVWRGHSDRIKVAEELRRKWDQEQELLETGNKIHLRGVMTHVKLLLRFANPSQDYGDTDRVVRCVSVLNRDGEEGLINEVDQDWAAPLTGIATLALWILGFAASRHPAGSPTPNEPITKLLDFLRRYALKYPDQLASIAHPYYSSLARLLRSDGIGLVKTTILQELFVIPLNENTDSRPEIYDGLLEELLTVPHLHDSIDLDCIASTVHPASLSSALHGLLTQNRIADNLSSETLSWLLAYYTRLFRLSCRTISCHHNAEMEHIAAVSILLTHLAEEIKSPQNFHGTTASTSLPEFVRTEISTLINQAAITNLLAQQEISESTREEAMFQSNDAAILASYVLTLLQVFPRRSDEIRMWLYLGSAPSTSPKNNRSERLPAIKFFFQAVSRTYIFREIYREPRGAIPVLGRKQKSSMLIADQHRLEQEWRVVLLFLELYTFVLKIMDDEEFMSGGEILRDQRSWTRQSALKLSEVKNLTVFLKNLAFAMYWYTIEISGHEPAIESRGLKEYFSSNDAVSSSVTEESKHSNQDLLIVPGIPSSAMNYVRGTVTGLLRMLYERDSRRQFLPKKHWLMKEFDMTGFIGAVLEEQKHRSRHLDGLETVEDELEDEFETYHRDAGLVGTSRIQAVRRNEVLKKQQQRAARRKRMEDTVPRLNILENMPFFIPFPTRVQIFREFVRTDQEIRRNGFVDPDQWRMSIMHSGFPGAATMASRDEFMRRHSAKVRRDRVFLDAYDKFYSLGEGLKEPIQITFVDQFDTPEAGIDGGGVTKEFLNSVTNEALTSTGELELFVENDQHLLFPNPELIEKQKHFLHQVGLAEDSPEWKEPIRDLLHQYEFLGRIVGKCLYEGILIDIHFAPFFLVKWALTGGNGAAANESGYRANINDLRDLDEELYQGLLQLKNYPGNVEDFALDFTITDNISFKDGAGTHSITRELRPNGANTPVTNENRLVYISYVARHRLQIQPHLQTSAFLRGLGIMIQPSWLSMFNQSELQTLVGGDSSEIDVADLRRNTLYGGVYVVGDDGEEHPTIKTFWRVMEELSDEDRRKLLKYVTSTPRSPLLGFHQLHPHFSIRDSGSDQSRLPSTSTCVNLLKLPIYRDKQVMKEKLVYAINAGAGFNLS